MSNHHHHHREDHQIEVHDAEKETIENTQEVETEIVPDAEIVTDDVQEAEVVTDDVQKAEVVTDDVQEAEVVTDDEVKEETTADDETTEETQETENVESSNDAQNQPSETDWKESYIRLMADFDNYRKRTSKEFDDVRRRERERVVGIWLDVYDNAERALQSLPEKEGPWYEGFKQLVMQMDKCLAALNIHPIDDIGKKFDPKRHDAIATCPNPAMENNTIMHVERRGFEYDNGDIARVARVIVVRNPS